MLVGRLLFFLLTHTHKHVGTVEWPDVAISKSGKHVFLSDPESAADLGAVSILTYNLNTGSLSKTQRLTGTTANAQFGYRIALDPSNKVLAVSERSAAVGGLAQAGAGESDEEI